MPKIRKKYCSRLLSRRQQLYPEISFDVHAEATCGDRSALAFCCATEVKYHWKGRYTLEDAIGFGFGYPCKCHDPLISSNEREINGSLPEPTMSLHAAALRGNTKELNRWKWLQRGRYGEQHPELSSPLHCAARAGDVGTVEQLIDQGAILIAANEYDISPLALAAKYGHTSVVKTLLKRGAAVDPGEIKRAYKTTKNVSVMEALIEYDSEKLKDLPPGELQKVAPWLNKMLVKCVERGRVAMLEYLLDLGVNPNYVGDDGRIPLHVAATEGHVMCVAALLKHNAYVDIRSVNRWTALHCASLDGYAEIAHVLLNAGADVEVKNVHGSTPYDLASGEATMHVIEKFQKLRKTLEESKSAHSQENTT